MSSHTALDAALGGLLLAAAALIVVYFLTVARVPRPPAAPDPSLTRTLDTIIVLSILTLVASIIVASLHTHHPHEPALHAEEGGAPR